MGDAGKALPLEILPDYYQELARDFRQAGARLVHDSLQTPRFSGLPPSWLLLRKGDIRTRFYIARSGGQTVFFFVRRAAPARVVLDAQIGFRIDIGNAAVRPTIALDRVRHFLVIPDFFRAEPSAADRTAAAKLLRATERDIFFLRLDTGLMAVSQLRLEAQPELRARVAWQMREEWRAVSEVSPGGQRIQWHIPPFLALARAIRTWAQQGFDQGERIEFSAVPQELETAPRQVLRHLVAAWVAAVNAAMPGYQVDDYLARVVLRLTADGQIAQQDGDDPFQLLATVRVTETAGEARVQVSLGPPDFLVAGPLHDAFLEALLQDRCLTELARRLQASTEQVRTYLQSAWKRGALVFRIRRHFELHPALAGEKTAESGGRGRDRDLIVLHDPRGELTLHLVFAIDCSINTASNTPVELYPDSLRVLFTLPPKGPTPADEHKLELVRYFLRLLAHLRDWFGVIR